MRSMSPRVRSFAVVVPLALLLAGCNQKHDDPTAGGVSPVSGKTGTEGGAKKDSNSAAMPESRPIQVKTD